MARRRETVQRRRAELGPDDLLHRLDAAFQGEAGETLASRIRAQFPVALVDEFQDTDRCSIGCSTMSIDSREPWRR